MIDFVQIGLQLLRLVIAVVLAVVAQYIAIKVFDKMTKRVDEFEELKKGNVAVAIILGAVIVSVATVISSGIASIVLPTSASTLAPFAVSIFWLLIAIAVAITAQFIALSVFDALTVGIDEQKELKKRNVAVAIVLAAVIYAVSSVVAAGIPAG